MTISIHRASKIDADAIKKIHISAFRPDEGESVAALANDLLIQPTTPETISLVAQSDGEIVGHVAFSPLRMKESDEWLGYILAPLGVDPTFQSKGVGSTLVRSGLAQVRDAGTAVVFVYGDPNYYGRFGFDPEVAVGFRAPHKLQYPFGWQAMGMGSEPVSGSTQQLVCVPALDDPALW